MNDASSLPENYDFSGFVLTNLDGTEFHIEREALGEHFFVGETAAGNYAKAYVNGSVLIPTTLLT